MNNTSDFLDFLERTIVVIFFVLVFLFVGALLFWKPQAACKSKILNLRDGYSNEVSCSGDGVPSIQTENNQTFLICTCPTKSGESK